MLTRNISVSNLTGHQPQGNSGGGDAQDEDLLSEGGF